MYRGCEISWSVEAQCSWQQTDCGVLVHEVARTEYVFCVIRQTDTVPFANQSFTLLSVAVIKQIQVSRMEWILCDVICVTDVLEIGLFYERVQIRKIVLNAHNLCRKKKAGKLEVKVPNHCTKLHCIGFGVGPLEKLSLRDVSTFKVLVPGDRYSYPAVCCVCECVRVWCACVSVCGVCKCVVCVSKLSKSVILCDIQRLSTVHDSVLCNVR